MAEAKKNNDIKIQYVIKSLGKAEEDKEITMVLEPVDKPKMPGKPMQMMTELSGALGMDEEDIAKAKKFTEGLLGEVMKMSSLYQIPVTLDQLKKLNKTIGDKVTVTVQ